MEEDFEKNNGERHSKNSFFAGLLAGLLASIIVVAVSFAVIAANKNKIGDYLLSGAGKEPGNLKALDGAIVNLVNKTNPAVVSIVFSKEVPDTNSLFDNPNLFPDGFWNFLKDSAGGFENKNQNSSLKTSSRPEITKTESVKKELGGGTGFIISPDGTTVTNKHVVDQDGVNYFAYTNDGVKHSVKIIAKDPVLDIAVIKISGDNFPYLELGDSDKLSVGQSVIAIGNALGQFRNTVSKGIVSGLSRSIEANDALSGNAEFLDEVIQTDAAINPGNSGGPLIDMSGKVVGVNVAVAYGSQGIGFSLPSNEVSLVMNSIDRYGKIKRPFLGIRYVQITPELESDKNLPVGEGVLVEKGQSGESAVISGSPADKAGFKEGDIILEAGGVKLDKDTSLAGIIRRKNIGDKVGMKILRAGKEKILTVTLGEASAE